MHVQREVGDLKPGCPGRWEVISVGCSKRQRRGGIFNVLHAGCIDLFWNDPINHLVQCTV